MIKEIVVLIVGVLLFKLSIEASVLHEKLVTPQEHYNGKEHNSEFDHEAFLGKKETEKFKELTEEESLKRLAKIFDKIDLNNDSFIVEEELYNWITAVNDMSVREEVDKRWKLYDPEEKGFITVKTLLKVNYDSINHWTEEEKTQRRDQYDRYLILRERDRVRFDIADADSNENLNKSEYAAFLFPDRYARMRDIVINETFADMDRNNDSYIDVEEFVMDIYPKHKEGRPDPEWVTNERENFKAYHDMNGDGKLDRSELANWVLPEGYDAIDAETKHLIYEADLNQDSKLSKEEVLNKANIFVSSQMTANGNLYHREDL